MSESQKKMIEANQGVTVRYAKAKEAQEASIKAQQEAESSAAVA